MCMKPIKSSLGVAICLFFVVGLEAGPAEVQFHLPQVRTTIRLNDEAAKSAREYFSTPSADKRIPDALQLGLLQSLPADFLRACTSMVKSWGSEAAGTETWHVGVLSQQGQRAWLSFRCASAAGNLGDYSDERLGLLRLDTGKLELIPLGGNAANDSTLYHVGFAEDLPLGQLEVQVFRVTSTSDNPCCGGTDTHSEERLVGFVDSPGGIVQSLSVVTERTDTSHSDDPQEDAETFYNADVQFERNPSGQVTGVTATFRETKNRITYENGPPERQQVSTKSGTLRYRWDPQTLKFDEVK